MILYLVCEDELSQCVMQKLTEKICGVNNLIYRIIGRRGNGYIKKKINDFNNTNNNLPFFVLIDLDTVPCAPQLIKKWLKNPCRSNLLIRIAVREVESWLLADTKGFSGYLNVNHDFIKKEIGIPDNLSHPKEKLIALVEKSKKSELKNDIVRKETNRYMQGPQYNSCLIDFVNEFWDITRARSKSDSLDRTLRALQKFKDQM